MDSLMLHAMMVELDSVLAGSRVDRIVQTTPGTLVVKLWTGREKCQLLLRADAQGSFYLSRQSHPAPASPPRFCQLLRARLRRLQSISAEKYDRIVHFQFSGAEGAGYDLILELLGKQGNLILVDETGRIVDLLWRQEGERSLLPGKDYRLPEPRQQISWLDASDDLCLRLQTVNDPITFLEREVTPWSPALSRALRSKANSGKLLQKIFARLRQDMQNRHFAPSRVSWQGSSGLLPFDFGLDGFDRVESFPDLSTLLESRQEIDTDNSMRDLPDRFGQIIRRQRKKLFRRLENIAADNKRHAAPDELRMAGDLLLANLHRVQRGQSQVDVDDYFLDPPEPRTIKVDPMLTPQQNAERYFKLYRKARRGQGHHARRQLETEQELAWLDQVEMALEDIETADDLYQIQLELETAGLLRKSIAQLGRRRQQRPYERLHSTTSPGGWQIFWGRNNRTNDHLSREMTDPDDLWMHAHRIPGCHLLLKTSGHLERINEEDILFAAALAAGYSRGKDDGKVEVMVAEGRHVRKPKGARPGLVTIDRFRTVVVRPRRLEAE